MMLPWLLLVLWALCGALNWRLHREYHRIEFESVLGWHNGDRAFGVFLALAGLTALPGTVAMCGWPMQKFSLRRKQDVRNRSAAKERGALAAPGAGAATGAGTDPSAASYPVLTVPAGSSLTLQGILINGQSFPLYGMSPLTGSSWTEPPAPAPEPAEPERTSLQAVRGWRSFTVDSKGVLLSSVQPHQVWLPYEAMEAACEVSITGHEEHHAAPVWSCSCGLYAYKERGRVDPGYGSICCEVALWGRVIVHETGYRAQFAYPQKVLCDSAEGHVLAAKVGARYGIPLECSHE